MTSRSADSIGTVSIERARYPVFSSKLRLWRSVFVLGVDSSLVEVGDVDRVLRQDRLADDRLVVDVQR